MTSTTSRSWPDEPSPTPSKPAERTSGRMSTTTPSHISSARRGESLRGLTPTAELASRPFSTGGFGVATSTGSEAKAGPAGSFLAGEHTSGRSPSSSRSTTETPIEWERLSERGQAILRVVGARTWLGYSEAEIASELGTSRRWVSSRLDELREELASLGQPPLRV
jgi:hypothetical protein